MAIFPLLSQQPPVTSKNEFRNDFINMGKSAPEEAPKASSSKRKGARSVSTLTPAQLQRKRANDREAQRAIRARTKNHIETLEKELSDLKKSVLRDTVVRDLFHKVGLLEQELRAYREKDAGGRPIPYHPPVYDGNLSGSSSSRGSSFEQQHSFESTPLSADYPSAAGYGIHNAIGMEAVNPAWEVGHQTVSPAASSPISTSATEDNGQYIPSSAPAMIDGSTIPPTSVPVLKQSESLHYDHARGESPYGRLPHYHALHGGAPYVQHTQQWPTHAFPGHYSH